MATFFNPGSLQGKITSAYITLVVCTAVLGFVDKQRFQQLFINLI
jgi:hypothetical protein